MNLEELYRVKDRLISEAPSLTDVADEDCPDWYPHFVKGYLSCMSKLEKIIKENEGKSIQED